MNHYLSKSQFVRGMKCDKSLWMYRERRDLQDPTSAEQQAIFDQGTAVGVLAQSWIGGGVLIKADHADPQAALQETQAAIAAGEKVLYEAAFLHDDVLIRADIVALGPGGVWDLFEVKSTTEVEEEHLLDAAVQRYVMKGAGIAVGHVHVVHLNTGYVRQGELDLKQLFKSEDVTALTDKILPNIPGQLKRMKAVSERSVAPPIAIGAHCFKPHDCDFKGTCWAQASVPEYSVLDLSGARKEKKFELWNGDVKTIAEIPAGTKLTGYQTIQRDVAKSGQAHVDMPALHKWLGGFGYPRFFLDFEAVNEAVPRFTDTRPYQQLPFEASLHVMREPGAEIEHYEYLADERSDPRQGLIEFLRGYLADHKGPVLAYHAPYEKGIIKALANFTPITAAGAHLNYILERFVDLADPFRQAMYYHPDQLGKWSIKAVGPIFAPDLSYKTLSIQNGAQAMAAYALLLNGGLSPEAREALRSALKEYCGQDTAIMIRILAGLEQIAAGKAVAA